MTDVYEKLRELGERLQKENKHDDAALIFSVMITFAPMPKAKYEKMSNPIPGYYLHTTIY